MHHNSAFINVLSEEGDKEDAMFFLQQTWNELMDLRAAIIKLGFTLEQVNTMQKEGTLGKVF